MDDSTLTMQIAVEMTRSVKYIFLDVVQFTHNRNVEAQSEIVNELNRIVLAAVGRFKIIDDDRLFIPTGDGLCIALINTEGRYAYDIHISVARTILELLEEQNKNQSDDMRRFQIRIGINSNEDNLIRDINGRENLAGAGISMASRIMDKASGGQILVGESVFERLQQREIYMNNFRDFEDVDKHGKPFRLYQFVGKYPGLNTETPRTFQELPIKSLTRQMAFYLAYAIQNRDFISSSFKASTINADILQPLLYLLSNDGSDAHAANESDSKLFYPRTWKFNEAGFEQQFEHYRSLSIPFNGSFTRLITEQIESNYKMHKLFTSAGYWMLFVSDKGKAKLKGEFPDIWARWGLA